MKVRFGLVLAMLFGLGFTGCASGGGGGGTDVATLGSMASGGSAGLDERDTDNTEAAEDAIEAAEEASSDADAEMHYRAAMQSAEAAIAEMPQNPLAHRLAGVAALGLKEYEVAAGHLDRAEELRPLYEFDFVGMREAAWIDLYQEATPFVQAGDYASATEHFENANTIYDRRPEAMITLGQIYAQLREHDKAIENLDAAIAFRDSESMANVDSATAAGWNEQIDELPFLRAQVFADAGRFEDAVGTYREMSAADPTNIELKRGLGSILMQMGNEEEGFAVFDEMLTMPGLSSEDYFSIGVGFYQGSEYGRAVQAFEGAAEASVNDRDAIEMWARSLQLDSAYAEVPAVAERWTDLDPNSQNAYLILAQASNQNGDQETTQAAIQAVDGLDVAMNDLQLRRFGTGGATVSGSVVNKTMAEGSSVSIRFTFYGPDGTPIGTVTESVGVGAVDMAEVFTVQFDSAEYVGGYGYVITG